MRKFLLLFLWIPLLSVAQGKFEFMGVIKLNGSDKSMISYRLAFQEEDGVIRGYSITDLGGANETKNMISGTYDSRTKMLTFNEDGILYTKSPYSQDIFCFVHFSGKVKLKDNSSTLEGAFKGLYKNNKKCIDGTLLLIGSAKIEKLVNKLSSKLQKTKKVDEATKRKYNPVRMLDSLKINNLNKGQNLNVFTKYNKVILEIWDAENEDGDSVRLTKNGVVLLDNYSVLNKKKTIPITLEPGQNVFVIEALNEGQIKPNTATIQIIDEDRTFELKTNLKLGEKASVTVLRNAD